MEPCRFEVGQKVVCVNDRTGLFRLPGYTYSGGLDGLRANVIYKIRAIYVDELHGKPCVLLNEIRRGYCGGAEVGYRAVRFRPATDISMLERICHVQDVPMREDEVV